MAASPAAQGWEGGVTVLTDVDVGFVLGTADSSVTLSHPACTPSEVHTVLVSIL